ncbi:MAG: hypothetical protein AB8B86_10300 [Pseudomonadales bacterium]
MATIKRLQRRTKALATVHKLLVGEERTVARQLGECRQKEHIEQQKLSSLQDYYNEYLENMRQAQLQRQTGVKDRVRQQLFLSRLQTVIERQQLEIQAIQSYTQRATELWISASRRERNMGDQLHGATRQLNVLSEQAADRQTEEESEQRRAFDRRSNR